MSRLMKSSVDNNHDHIVYLREILDEAGDIIEVLPSITTINGSSKKDDHFHAVVFDEGVGNWVIQEVQGHTHSIEGLVPKDFKGDDASDVDKVMEALELKRDVLEYEKENIKASIESEGFFSGRGQWGEGERNKLYSENRAALVINEVEGKIDVLGGIHRQNRTDTRYMPVEDGDNRVADILTLVVKNIMGQCGYEFEENSVFEDVLITGRGAFNIFVDYDDSIEGKIVIERLPWHDLLIGPHDKMDLSDCDYLFKVRWIGVDKAKRMFPDKKDEIKGFCNSFLNGVSGSNIRSTPDVYDGYDDYYSGMKDIVSRCDVINSENKEIQILELFRKEYQEAKVLINSEDDFYENAAGWSPEDINSVLDSIPGFTSIDRVNTRMRVTRMVGGVLLDDEYPVRTIGDVEVDVADFPVVPAYGKKRGRLYWGKVESAKDLQREINKRHSQEVDILNKMVADGYFYSSDQFESPAMKNFWLQNSTSAGWRAALKDINNRPVREDGARFPQEIIQSKIFSSGKLKEVMNVPDSLQGTAQGNDVSGVALAELNRRALSGNEGYYDNFSLAKKSMGKKLIKFIQDVYTPSRILKVITKAVSEDPELQIGGHPAANLQEGALLNFIEREIFDNFDLSNIDVVVTESKSSPTARMSNALILADLMRQGAIPADPNLLMEMFDFPNKDMVIKSIKGQQQAAAQMEQQKQMVELEKTRIAGEADVMSQLVNKPGNRVSGDLPLQQGNNVVNNSNGVL